MNYQHAFHAGNFADCFKHTLLIALLDALARKESPFFVLDTHAGAGFYDLESTAARRTREAETGIRQLLVSRPAGLHRYLGLVDQLGLYPGSPVLTRAVMRTHDRLICCELHADVVLQLRNVFQGDPQVHVHRRSGWEAITALLPPPNERRGLVFVDPPFEQAGEFKELAGAIARLHDRFGHGVLAGWYPITRPATVRNFYAEVIGQGVRDVLAVEFRLRETLSSGPFNGCGMVVVNPPYVFAQEVCGLAEAVLHGLGPEQPGAGVQMIRLADE